MALPPYDPKFTMAWGKKTLDYEFDQDHDETESAAIVAAELISSARHAAKLDSERTEYSARYLVDNAAGQNLTVRKCLEFALKNGIPKAEDWPLLKPPPSYKPDLVSLRGEVVEHEDLEEVHALLKHQTVGAKLHVFQQNAIYCGSSGETAKYVGLRDGIVEGVEKFKGKSVARVKVWYKKKFITVKVALSRVFYDPWELGLRFCLLTFLSHAYPSEILSI
ncbi:unnamed protein product [Microthlaspi erraticum]|uniref:Uncharacterized protein n=1 Tax=Microthlaspi erraticum TaxID=1685480 RepID=A0A6D2KDY2_9BRAS|nr:unnamed protein product [Microthlaspi erraticum]